MSAKVNILVEASKRLHDNLLIPGHQIAFALYADLSAGEGRGVSPSVVGRPQVSERTLLHFQMTMNQMNSGGVPP
jgi:hypothetical protein